MFVGQKAARAAPTNNGVPRMEKLPKWLVPHKIVYGALAALYAGACLGLDKPMVWGLVALSYVVLAAN